jgi:hypothetical protein
VFEFERFAEACVALGARTRPREDSAAADLYGVGFAVTRSQLIASRGEWKAEAEDGLRGLAEAGFGGEDAIWIHCRSVPFADRLPVKGVTSLTLRASFEGGVTVRCDAGFADEDAAKAAAAVLERWKGLKLEPVALRDAKPETVARVQAFLGSLTVSVEGASLRAQCSVKDQTPESLLEGVVDLAALYPVEEIEGEGEPPDAD